MSAPTHDHLDRAIDQVAARMVTAAGEGHSMSRLVANLLAPASITVEAIETTLLEVSAVGVPPIHVDALPAVDDLRFDQKE